MFRKFASGLAIAALILPSVSQAQGQGGGRPDEGTSWKYFYFHNPDVTKEQARADVIECQRYSSNLVVFKSGSTPTYSSVPHTGSAILTPAAAALVGGISGLAGALIGGLMDGGDRRAMQRANLRRCFGFKGYDRYELTKDEYRDLYDGEPEVVRARLVEKATGEQPEAERLVP